jgi:Protein of unknown function (DUF2840)
MSAAGPPQISSGTIPSTLHHDQAADTKAAPAMLPAPRICCRILRVSSDRSRQMSDLTTVELLWLEKRIENRIRFGKPVSEKVIDRHRRALSFAAGSIFAFVRWTSGDFGTVLSRIDILRAPGPGQRYSTVPWVSPGGESLLRLSGWPKVERVLQLIDAVEALGIDPAGAAPEYWHHVHNRLSVNEAPRIYTRARHLAWLHRRRVTR